MYGAAAVKHTFGLQENGRGEAQLRNNTFQKGASLTWTAFPILAMFGVRYVLCFSLSPLVVFAQNESSKSAQ